MVLADYRTKGAIMGLELGRSLLDDRLTIDLSFLYAQRPSIRTQQPDGHRLHGGEVRTIPSVYNNCYGTRAGATYEGGFTLTAAPSLHWFMFLDYRLVGTTAGGYVVPPVMGAMVTPLPQSTILTHVLLLRLEARY